MSLYAEYIRERESLEIIEHEDGFVTYKIVGKECFLADMYVRPHQRGNSLFKRLIYELCKIARANKCDHISTNIHTLDVNCSRAIKAALKVDFSIINANNGTILLVKKLGVQNG